MSDEVKVPDAWIKFVASVISDAQQANILHKLDDMTDEEIDAALEKVRKPYYNRSSMQTSRVAPEKPSSNVGLVSAPTSYVG